MKPISNIVYWIQYLTTSFILAFQENTHILKSSKAGRHIVEFGDLNIDIFLEVQDKKYSYILYLINYIAYGLHVWYNIEIFKVICRTPISLHPGLGSSLPNAKSSGGQRPADIADQLMRSAGKGHKFVTLKGMYSANP